MATDFDPRGANGRFPPTRPSAIGALASDDPGVRARGFERVVRIYWKPSYKHVRLRWRRSPEDATDITQGFFAHAFERQGLSAWDPSRARFRTYLKGGLDKHVLESDRHAGRRKRGAGAVRLSLDFDGAEEELASSGELDLVGTDAAEGAFEREWTRSLVGAAVNALEEQCRTQDKPVYFEVFRRYVIEPECPGGVNVSYADVAAACGITVSDVTNYLAWTKRELRGRILDALREVTASEEELREEARAALGIEL